VDGSPRNQKISGTTIDKAIEVNNSFHQIIINF
jgi:hypothetical protein